MSGMISATVIHAHQRSIEFVDRPSRGCGHLDILVALSLLALVSFSLPGREIPDSATSLDLIGLTKIAIRLGIVAWFGILTLGAAYAQLRRAVADRGDNVITFVAGLKWTSPVLVPWMAFASWAGLTLLWTPLKSVSAGQWLGLVALLLIAQMVYVRIRATSAGPILLSGTNTEWTVPWTVFVRDLGLILFFYSLIVLCVHLAAPNYSGLDRNINYRGDNGFVHPTAAGATASLGLALAAVMLSHRHRRGKVWLMAASLVHVPLLILSASRAALAMAILAFLLCGTLLMGRQIRALVLIGLGLLLMAAVLIDPGFELLRDAWQGTSHYVQRGQSTDQIRAFSGRMEMWEAVWKEYAKSPIVGHGYFVTSETGRLAVWGSRANHDSHHVVLQVLVTTGLIGGLLFGWAIFVAVYQTLRLLIRFPPGSSGRELGWLLLIMGLWYLGWSQGSVTFIGPVRPESVLFFALLGLLAGVTPAHSEPQRSEHGGRRI